MGLTLGLSQWTLNKPMWGFWILPAALVGVVGMWYASLNGKKLAQDEMWMLKHFVDEALGYDCFKMASMSAWVV